MTNSPIKGVWTIYSCKTYIYAWRSTEPEENTKPNKYPESFRLKAEDLAKFPLIDDPAIATKLNGSATAAHWA